MGDWVRFVIKHPARAPLSGTANGFFSSIGGQARARAGIEDWLRFVTRRIHA
jgi:hypothetical protein